MERWSVSYSWCWNNINCKSYRVNRRIYLGLWGVLCWCYRQRGVTANKWIMQISGTGGRKPFFEIFQQNVWLLLIMLGIIIAKQMKWKHQHEAGRNTKSRIAYEKGDNFHRQNKEDRFYYRNEKLHHRKKYTIWRDHGYIFHSNQEKYSYTPITG